MPKSHRDAAVMLIGLTSDNPTVVSARNAFLLATRIAEADAVYRRFQDRSTIFGVSDLDLRDAAFITVNGSDQGSLVALANFIDVYVANHS